MGRSRYKITDPEQPHFITLTVLHWISVFTRPETVPRSHAPAWERIRSLTNLTVLISFGKKAYTLN